MRTAVLVVSLLMYSMGPAQLNAEEGSPDDVEPGGGTADEPVDLGFIEYLGTLVLHEGGWVGPEDMVRPTDWVHAGDQVPSEELVRPEERVSREDRDDPVDPEAVPQPNYPEDAFDRDLREEP